MTVNIGTELVNSGNTGWNNLDVMNALEKVFYNMGWNSGTQKNGVPICLIYPGGYNTGNSANGNWGSITINRTYVNNVFKCRDYESVISIEHSWPMSGISRESEIGTACQLPDGRWQIIESTNS